MELCLRDKIIAVAGGAGATGTAICEVLENEGAVPIIIDLDKGRNFTINSDLTDYVACEKAVGILIKNFGRIDGVVNCVSSYDLLLLEALPWLKKSGGAIVNITDLPAGSRGAASEAIYGGLIKGWAKELEGTGIRINAILAFPGADIAHTVAFILAGRGGLAHGELIHVEAIPEDSQFD